MGKAEKFIQDYTRNCSNQYDLPECFENGIERMKEYQPWLTPDQARSAVEIAREEIYEWLRVNLCNYFDASRGDFEKFLDDLKKYLEDKK